VAASFLVEAGFEMDVVGFELRGETGELQIETADGRAAIAGDETASVSGRRDGRALFGRAAGAPRPARRSAAPAILSDRNDR